MPTLVGNTYNYTDEEVAEIKRKDAEKKRQEELKKFYPDAMRQGLINATNRQPPQMVGAQIAPVRAMDTALADQFRGRQMALADQYAGVASGQQQGAGELAVQRAAQRALGNVAGAATMARGNSAVGGARAAARGVGAIGLGAAGQAQQAALNDQMAARQALGGLLGQGREQDLGTAGANMSAENTRALQQAGLTQSASEANLRSQLQTMGLNDNKIMGILNMFNQQQMAKDGKPPDPGMMDYVLKVLPLVLGSL